MKKIIIFQITIFALFIIIISCVSCVRYDYVSEISEGLAAVSRNGKWGFIDEKKKLVIPLKYDGVYSFSEGVALVNIGGHKTYSGFSGGKWGIINKTNEIIVPIEIEYYYIENFSISDGLAKVGLYGKWGFIDKTGKEVIPIKYDHIEAFSENGLAGIKLNNKFGLIDKTGKVIVAPTYDRIDNFKNGLAKVILNKKSGIIDKTGKEVIPIRYDDISDFEGGLAHAKLGNKWEIIDKTGKVVNPPKSQIARKPQTNNKLVGTWSSPLDRVVMRFNKNGTIKVENYIFNCGVTQDLYLLYTGSGKYSCYEKNGVSMIDIEVSLIVDSEDVAYARGISRSIIYERLMNIKFSTSYKLDGKSVYLHNSKFSEGGSSSYANRFFNQFKITP